ncbi:hypothetical protein [Acidicapsa acidisoli]|uniref:hypothetical protein n=1 Tax=Acidicapsa acidisoli TaxID=1615681 RepID=UPI0021E02E9C|nr:hypothetical protein [Acidicapsa acidisoli]
MDLTNVDLKGELLRAAKAYCKRKRITLGSLGKKMVNDRKFFVEMDKEDRGCTLDTFQRLIRELSSDVVISIPKKQLSIGSRINT